MNKTATRVGTVGRIGKAKVSSSNLTRIATFIKTRF